MKKIRLFSLLALIIISLTVFVGCKDDDKISSISLKDHDPAARVEVGVGEFDVSGYTLLLNYESGDTEELPLTEDMIVPSDIVKLYQVGEHDITVTYGEFTCSFKVLVKRASFGEVTFPENNVFTYDGKPHTVEVEGNLPADAIVTYPGGNSFVNAGTYDVSAIISCDGYATVRLSTTVTIQKASYDMSGVKFESKEFTYDGKSHSVEIDGELPEGVSSPTYVMGEKFTSSATEAGVYNVVAKFVTNNPNYEPIPDMQATLTITPATYEIKGVSLVFKRANGGIIENFSKVYDGESVVFDINDYDKLSGKVSVSFEVFNEAGEQISTSNKVTNIKDAGVYTVKANFALANGKNYKPIEPVVCEFVVEKAAYPVIQNVKLESALSTYNGKEQSIKIEGTLPGDVEVSYIYYLGGEPVLDENGEPVQSIVNAGRYTVEAVFTHKDGNLANIPPLTAAFNVEKITVDSFVIGYSIASPVTYNGSAFEAKFMSWKDTNAEDFDILEYGEVKYYVLDTVSGKYVEMQEGEKMIEVGSYRITIPLTIKEEYTVNYVFSDGTTSQLDVTNLEIRKARVMLPDVSFSGSVSSTYSGDPHNVTYTSDADESKVDVTATYYRQDGSAYVALGIDEKPVNVGVYKLVVTATLKDAAHTVFSDGTSSAEYTFNFEIKKLKIYVDDLFENDAQYQYTGNDLRQHPYENISWEIRRHVAFAVDRIDEYDGYLGWVESYYGVENRGYYSITYILTVKDSANVTLIYYGGTENSSVVYYHYFYIV